MKLNLNHLARMENVVCPRLLPVGKSLHFLKSQGIKNFWVFLVAAPLFINSHAYGSDAAASSVKGEYILMRDNEPESQNLCKTFTRNLNEFRHLPFKECHPRLSPKYPEFSRPQWEEIPYDLALAERAVRATNGRIDLYPEAAARAEKHWQRWLVASEKTRNSGQTRMWRTRIDFDGDGLVDTIIRMVPDSEGRIDSEPPYNCDYNRGQQYISETAHPEIADSFNRGPGGGDIVHFGKDKRYYWIGWDAESAPTGGRGPQSETPDIGGAAGVLVSQLSWNGHLVTRGLSCVIHWVPAGHYRPLKRKAAKH